MAQSGGFQSFADLRVGGEVAPIPVIRETAPELRDSTLNDHCHTEIEQWRGWVVLRRRYFNSGGRKASSSSRRDSREQPMLLPGRSAALAVVAIWSDMATQV